MLCICGSPTAKIKTTFLSFPAKSLSLRLPRSIALECVVHAKWAEIGEGGLDSLPTQSILTELCSMAVIISVIDENSGIAKQYYFSFLTLVEDFNLWT